MNQNILFSIVFIILIAGLLINAFILLEERTQIIRLQSLIEDEGCAAYFESTSNYPPNFFLFNVSNFSLPAGQSNG